MESPIARPNPAPSTGPSGIHSTPRILGRGAGSENIRLSSNNPKIEREIPHEPVEQSRCVPMAQDGLPGGLRATVPTSSDGPVYSVFTPKQKRFIIFMAAYAGFFSPVSGAIYFPALNSLARDLKVSNSLINLTLTSYMIFQGLAPAFIGNLADAAGRRVAYTICFAIYIAANIGLALQNSYAALFVLRCLQSCGSSATIAMASGVVADIATASERGKWMGFTYAGSVLGPAIGPLLGGVLAQFLGWRAIFWFLVIIAATFMIIFAIFFPETARNIVGDGSIPPKGWNRSLIDYLADRRNSRNIPKADLEREATGMEPESLQLTRIRRKIGFPNPLSSLKILLDRANALLLLYNAFIFAAFYDVTAIIPSQFAAKFSFNDLQLGLCYVPFGVGCMLAALTNGIFLDRNFARWCKKLNVTIKKGTEQDLSKFPIEKARLQIGIPACYASAILIIIFGWILDLDEPPLAALLVVLLLVSFSMSIVFNVMGTLLVDFYPKKPATATAASNLVRCWLGAGATAVLLPMVKAMGIGWTFSALGLFSIATSPMLWALYFWGMRWRGDRKRKEDKKEAKKSEKSEKIEGEKIRPKD